ncbi:lipase family protein, partial [Streptomyces galbus]
AGLTLTVLLVAAACEVALDLTAWQCAGTRACAERHTWLGFLSPALSHGGWWSLPGRRLALAALVPTALTVLLWYLSHRTWRAYESSEPLTRAPEAEHRPGPTAMSRPGFWYGRRLVARLRAAHTAAGLLTVAAAVGTAAAREDRRPGGPPLLDALGWCLVAALVGGATAVVWVVCRRGRSDHRLDRALDAHLVRRLPLATLVLLGLTTVYAGWSRPGWYAAGRLPGDTTFGALALGQGLTVLALALVAALLHRAATEGAAAPEAGSGCDDGDDGAAGAPGGAPEGGTAVPGAGAGASAALGERAATAPDGHPATHGRVALHGLGGPAVAMLACALGGVMSGGVAQRVADWLDGTQSSLDGPPALLTWQASVIPLVLLVLLALAALLGRATWRRARAERAEVRRDYGIADDGDPGRTGTIARVRAMAPLTDRAQLLVGVTAVSTLLLGAGAIAGALATGRTPSGATEGMYPFVHGAAQTAQALGSWLVGLGFLLFVTWGRRAYKDPSARRTIGILWDVGTFWPRAAHPFAPPCYAERAVPDLTWRMATWTRATGGRLVISGHSQGSVLAAAAAWQLEPRDRARVGLLTYGSPLERLYGRWFPAHFGPDALSALHRDVDCWRNLYRLTDPIGGPVRLPGDCGPAVDRAPLKDPLEYGRTARHPLPAPLLGHSDYQADPAFAEERALLLGRLLPLPEPRQPGAS